MLRTLGCKNESEIEPSPAATVHASTHAGRELGIKEHIEDHQRQMTQRQENYISCIVPQTSPSYRAACRREHMDKSSLCDYCARKCTIKCNRFKKLSARCYR